MAQGTGGTPNRRDLEEGIQKDFSSSMSYADYLRLDELLSAQQPLHDPEHHDELLFIVQHQTSELWLKLMIARAALGARAAAQRRPLARAEAAGAGQAHPAHAHRAVVGARDADAVGVRRVPRRSSRPVSGFQSHQYREVEFLLGNKNADMVKVFDHDRGRPTALAELLRRPSLYDEFLRLPRPPGLRRPARLLDRDVTRRTPPTPSSSTASVGLRRARRALGRLRDLRGARRRRGHLPALALPPPPDRAADHRPQARHRRVVRASTSCAARWT